MKRNNDDEIEIDLLQLFRALWSKALIIILVAVLTASAVFAFTFFFISPSYDATASIYVNNSSFSFGSTSFSISSSELNASNSLVNTYIYILKSRTTLEDVSSTAELPYTFEKLSKMISTNAVTGTAAFDVTVRSSSPTEAELMAAYELCAAAGLVDGITEEMTLSEDGFPLAYVRKLRNDLENLT